MTVNSKLTLQSGLTFSVMTDAPTSRPSSTPVIKAARDTLKHFGHEVRRRDKWIFRGPLIGVHCFVMVRFLSICCAIVSGALLMNLSVAPH